MRALVHQVLGEGLQFSAIAVTRGVRPSEQDRQLFRPKIRRVCLEIAGEGFGDMSWGGGGGRGGGGGGLTVFHRRGCCWGVWGGVGGGRGWGVGGGCPYCISLADLTPDLGISPDRTDTVPHRGSVALFGWRQCRIATPNGSGGSARRAHTKAHERETPRPGGLGSWLLFACARSAGISWAFMTALPITATGFRYWAAAASRFVSAGAVAI